MWRPISIALVALASAAGCSGSKEGCSTNQDCVEQGLELASCVNRACVRACEKDLDCRDPQTPDLDNGQICQAFVCAPGCAAGGELCQTGESCVGGRCLLFLESFEPAHCPNAQDGDVLQLACLGFGTIASFDGTPRKPNKSATIVWTGPSDCTPADPPDRCAGPAADGRYYLALEREKVPPTRSLEFDDSCSACRCCLECIDPSQRAGATTCLGVTFPNLNACMATPPAECQGVCGDCNGCMARQGDGFGEGLNACEAIAAARTCAACETYEACQRANPNMPQACAAERPACWACRDARTETDPDRRREAEMACQTQGPNGCDSVPIAAPRSVLSDDEQAIESPPIDLSAATGPLVLELSYIPFNVQRCYKQVVQDADPRTWPTLRQEVTLQLCAGSCEQSASWVDATIVPGAPPIGRLECAQGQGGGDADLARFPREDELGNSLQFQEQVTSDWRIGLLQATIPDSMRSATFRFRLVPRLDEDTRVGIDRIVIRRAQ
jgi:hypothetical protein